MIIPKLFMLTVEQKIKIICPEHGIFEIFPSIHIQGQGCKECANNKRRKPLIALIEDFRKVHKDKYDYSKINYINSRTKIKIICPIHGIFEQTPSAHIRERCGCPLCSKNLKFTTETFIKKAKEIHEDKYDYSLVNYINAHSKIFIICPEHGVFQQEPTSHLRGHGCPTCLPKIVKSQGEKELLNFIKSFYKGKIIENDRTVIKPKELDIYLPELKLALEYNGEYWHNRREKEIPGYHENKRRICKEQDIILIEIWENEWKNNNQQTKDLIKTYFKGL